MEPTIAQIRKEIDIIYDDVINIRRQLHKNPELSEHEIHTEKLIIDKLNNSAIENYGGIAGHGVVGTIYGKNNSVAVGIRADIDALPICEHTDLPFASTNTGVMHACGHDFHTAILIGTGIILKKFASALPGTVKLFFQPSEETVGGAKQMIAEGCLENPHVENVIGLHVESTLPSGYLQFIPGAMNGASCEFEVKVLGRSCHGAHPDKGIDPLLPACAMVSSIQSIITRQIDPAQPALITVGQFHSGTKNNVIPDETIFSGIIRTLSMDNRVLIKSSLEKLCTNIAKSYGAQCIINFKDSYPTLENDFQLLDLVKSLAESAIGKDHVVVSSKPSLGSDDFSYFCHDSKGLYFNLGTFNGTNPSPIHSDHFNPDEDAIKTGILIEVLSSIEILKYQLEAQTHEK